MKEKHTDVIYKCTNCTYKTDNKSTYLSHIKNKHNIDEFI